MFKFFFIIIFHFIWAEPLRTNNLLDLQPKGREESTKEWGMKLKTVATWLKLCVAAVKTKSKYSLQGKCCSQAGQVLCSCGLGMFWVFPLFSSNFQVKYFHTNLPLVQRSWTPGQRAVRPQKVGFYVSELVFLHPLCCAGQTFTRELVNLRGTNSPFRRSIARGGC